MSKSTTTFSINLHFAPMTIAEDILNNIYTQASDAIDQYGLVDSYCYMVIPVTKKLSVKAKVSIDAATAEVKYFVSTSKNPKQRVPAINYTQAVRELRNLLAV